MNGFGLNTKTILGVTEGPSNISVAGGLAP
jgi:hypothetical protein